MRPAGSFVVEAGHPSLPGHFPGHPVVPGVVLLEAVFGCIAEQLPDRDLLSLASVKFLRAVPPDQVIDVGFDTATGDVVTFVCTLGGEPVLRGSARMQAIS